MLLEPHLGCSIRTVVAHMKVKICDEYCSANLRAFCVAVQPLCNVSGTMVVVDGYCRL